MAHLFIVRTPMQIVSAFEAAQYFHAVDNILIIIHNKQEKNPKQIQNVIEIFNLHVIFNTLIEIENKGNSTFLQSLHIIKELQKQPYDKVFLGIYGSVGRLFLANLSYKESYLIDDGTATIIAHQNIMNNQTPNFKEFRAIFFGLRIRHNTPIHFFTIFHLKKITNETIINHRFEYVKQHFLQQNHSDNTVYILGQNIIDVSIVSKEAYLYYIEQIINKYRTQNIIYMPHRAETLHEELYHLQNKNFTVSENNIPIELYFLKNRIYPSHIISFFTSALYTLNILFSKSTVESFFIVPEDIENHHDSVAQCQQFLETTSILQSSLQSYKACKML